MLGLQNGGWGGGVGCGGDGEREKRISFTARLD